MPTPTFWQRNSRKIGASLGLTFLLVLGLILFRQPLTRALLQHFSGKHNASIDCLEFEVDRSFNINIARLCISHPQVKAVIEQAMWQPRANTLSINSALITHLHVESPTVDTPGSNKERLASNFSLPAGLPQTDINQLTLQSPLLNKALHIKLSQASDESITISGDIQAKLSVDISKVTGAIEWSLADLSHYLVAAKQITTSYSELLNGTELPPEKIISAFEFDGQRLSSTSQVNLSTPLAFENCPVHLRARGDIKLAADISDMSINLDLGQLSIQAALQDCQLLQRIPANLRPEHVSLSQSSVINISKHGVTSTGLLFSSKDKAELGIKLTELDYSVDGGSSFDFGLNLSQSGDTDLPKLIFASAGHFSHGQQGIRIKAPQSSLTLTDYMLDGLALKQATSEFGLSYSSKDGLNGQGSLHGKNIAWADANIGSIDTQFSVIGPTINALKLKIHNQLKNISYQAKSTQIAVQQNAPQTSSTHVHAKQLTSELILHVVDTQQVSASGTSTLSDTTAGEFLSLKQLTFEHSARLNLDKNTLASEHRFMLNKHFQGRIDQAQRSIQLFVPEQAVANLQSLVGSLLPELTIGEGLISASASLQLFGPLISGELSLNNIKALYQEYQINDLNFQQGFIFNSAGFQLAPSKVTLASIDVGVPINNIQSSLQITDSKGKLSNTEGNILGGSFSLDDIWLDERAQNTELSLSDIELTKLVELQQQAGINVTGKVKGSLPIKLGSTGLSIGGGIVLNQGPGTLRISDNPAFDSIKAQQAELAFLENMDFERLSSSVKLDSDGLLLLDFSLLGTNPRKKQSVNFNYSHQENIFTLLKSLRLANSVANKINQKVSEGGRK
jgi:hypothetical protein